MKKPWLRVVLALSIDGRLAISNEESTHLGGKSDRKVLEEALAWSDGALIGSKTLSIHKTICLIKNEMLLAKRRDKGKPEQPVALVASDKKEFDITWPFFNQPIEKWLISSEKLSDKCMRKFFFKEQIISESNWAKTLELIYIKGLSNIVVLGGASIVSSLIKLDLVDEIQITITPKLIGGSHTWIPNEIKGFSKNLHQKDAWILGENNLLDDNELLLRYYRNNKHRIYYK